MVTEHPDYGPGDGGRGGDRCECGGIRYYHAPLPHGCDDCDCTEFRPAPSHHEAEYAAMLARLEDAVRDDEAMKDVKREVDALWVRLLLAEGAMRTVSR